MIRCFTTFLCLITSATAIAQTLDREPGLAKSRPEAGHYVQSGHLYMVPFTMRIPGSDIDFEMVPVPAKHQPSSLEPFWICKYEVSWEEFRVFMDEYRVFRELARDRKRVVNETNEIDAVTTPTLIYDPESRFGYTNAKEYDGKRSPATTMSRYSARQYSKWLSLISGRQFRLPTEREWEHACLAGANSEYSFGNDEKIAKRFACFDEAETRDGPMPCGSKEPNAWGIHDMHGNAAEWVLIKRNLRDHFQLRKEATIEPNTAALDAKSMKQMVFKGGDFTKPLSQCRATIRESATDALWEDDPGFPVSPYWACSVDATRIGFRLIMPLKRESREMMEQYWGPDSALLDIDIKSTIEEGRTPQLIVDPKLPPLSQKIKKRLEDANRWR